MMQLSTANGETLSSRLIGAVAYISFPASDATSTLFARIADPATVLPHSTFGGHVTSSFTWSSDSPYASSYWWSFGTESLSPAVFEILRSKRIGVTSLTTDDGQTQHCSISATVSTVG